MHKRFLSISGQTDDELLILLQKGNERAFTTIYERYHKLLYVVAFKYLKDNDTAKDAVQQVFLKLWESPGYRQPAGAEENRLPVQTGKRIVQSRNCRKDADIDTDSQNSLFAGHQTAQGTFR